MKKYFETIVVMAFACFLFLGIKEEPTPVHAESVAGVSAAVVPDVNVEIEFMEVTPVEEAVVEAVDETVVEVVGETIVEEVEEVPEETAENPEEPILEVVPEEIEVEPDYSVLNKRDGVNYFCGNKETFYNLRMTGVIRLLDEIGIEHGDYWVRDDGCKMLGSYIMLATDTRRWPKGTILETSLGTGMVVDHCSGSEGYGGLWVDVAVTW